MKDNVLMGCKLSKDIIILFIWKFVYYILSCLGVAR